MIFVYAAFTLYGPTFQRGSTNRQIGNSTVAGPTTPTAPKWESSPDSKSNAFCKQVLSLSRRAGLITIRVQKVWAVPISLATTFGIEISFFSFRY
jgi:hypothetical protein